jgi:hypothetical protein
VKPCTITTEGLWKYLNDCLRKFIKVAYKSGTKEQQYNMRRLIMNIDKIDLDGKGELQQRIIDVLLT